MANPYNVPQVSGRQVEPATQVQAPAVAMIVVSLVALIVGTLGLIADVFLIVSGMVEKLEAMNDGPTSEYTDIAIRVIWGIILLVASSFVLYGALQMKRLKNYRVAVAASIVAMIPLVGPCCLLGIPFGIWAVITLAKPGVRQSFS
jgi:hypothetical protein